MVPSCQNWDHLCPDLTETIFSHLPIISIVRAAAVCKIWRSIIASSARLSAARQSWFFLCGQNNVSAKNNRIFAFDPEANRWIVLSNSRTLTLLSDDLFAGSEGFLFAASSEKFSFRQVLRGPWRRASPLGFSRCNPLVGVFNEAGSGLPRIIVAGGVKSVGGLVDIEEPPAVEIYNPCSDKWEPCPPLPAEFSTRSSSQSLCSALFKRKLYVLGIHSCFISSFNLENRSWSGVQTLRPPGALCCFLISSDDSLLLAGLCNSPPSFNLWKVDEETMEFGEMAIMPQKLLQQLLLPGDEDADDNNNDGFSETSLKCVGSGNMIYVFNEDHHQNYPACVCEIKKSDSDSGKCYGAWRMLPSLPLTDGNNNFHKVISFCSAVSLANVVDFRH